MKNSKRRGAVKIPNVILRPAQVSDSRLSVRQSSPRRVNIREDDVSEERIDLNVGNKPFSGIVLCATGDLDKRTLFARAQELGAIRANDFTDQVTHLVADAPGSAKYQCAVERNLPILKANWVEDTYQTWLDGGMIDLEQSIRDHYLPIFSGIRLCITGIEDVDQRSRIHALLAKEGGTYLKSLDMTATHLLCCASDVSPKMKWASEYNRNQNQADKIRIIWEEWFWDSLEYGGRWSESDYEVSNPRPTRRFRRPHIPELMDQESNILHTATFPHRTPLPRSIPTSSLLGDDPPEYGQTNKQHDIGLRIFENILQTRCGLSSDADSQQPGECKDDEVERPIESCKLLNSKSQHEGLARPIPKPGGFKSVSDADCDSVLTRLSNHRATSFMCSPSGLPQLRQSFRSIASSSYPPIVPQILSTVGSSSCTSSINPRFFAGYTFRGFGEANGSTLRGAVEDHGGRWLIEEDEQDADFLVVRLVSGGLFWREGDENERAKYRTECWIERCIFEERICAPDEHIVFTPLKINTPVEGSENLQVSVSGLDPAETCWTKRLVRAIGGNIQTTFSRRSTHLVCPSRSGAKYDKAKEWHVSIVGMEWLVAIAISGKLPPILDNEVIHRVNTEGALLGHKADHRMQVKGKNKANEANDREGTIMDITNSASQESHPSERAWPSFKSKESSMETKNLTSDILWSARFESPMSRVISSSAVAADFRMDSPPMFGKPSTLLSVTSPEAFRTTMKPGSSHLSPQRTRTPSLSTPPTSKHATRRFSTAEIEEDKRTTQIPSSHSPSPLRIPVRSKSVTSPPISETGGLRTAITALLGKRGTEAREEVDGAKKPPSKSSKRPRLPSKVKIDFELGHGLSPALPFITESPPLTCLSAHEEGDVFSEEGLSSLRVIYEDPGQRAEKRRLIALFEKVSGNDGPNSPKSGGIDAIMDNAVTHPDGNAGTVPKKKSLRRSTRSSANSGI